MLADLSEMIDAQEGENALFSNLTESFRQDDGAIYVMPLCVQVPLLAGDGNVINK